MCIHMCVSGGQRLTLGIFLNLPLRHGLLLNLRLTDSASLAGQGVAKQSLTASEACAPPCLAFEVGDGDHVCVSSTFQFTKKNPPAWKLLKVEALK